MGCKFPTSHNRACSSSLVEIMTVHRAPYALMEVFYNFLCQFVLPDFQASTWYKLMNLIQPSLPQLTTYQRCSRDCSLTPVKIAAVNCQVGYPLRAEKVYSVELRTVFREVLSAVTWQNIYDATVGHTYVVPGSMCCIKCSPRFRKKMEQDSIPDLVSIPIVIGGDGLPLNHGKFGIAREKRAHDRFTDWGTGATFQLEKQHVADAPRAQLFVPSLLGTRHSVRNQALPYHSSRCDGRWTRDQKMVGSTWTGAWCCPSCKLRFVELTKGRWITSDFRVFLPRNHPFRTDPRFGEPCRDDPKYKTHEWYVRYGRRGEAMNANLLEDQKAKHIKALPCFHIRKQQAGENFQEYQTAMREAKQKHDRDTKLVEQALIDYQELGLDAASWLQGHPMVARLCMRRTLPADVKEKIGLFFTEQVVEIAHGIPKTEHTYWLHQFACKSVKEEKVKDKKKRFLKPKESAEAESLHKRSADVLYHKCTRTTVCRWHQLPDS
eukprot:g64964.t1